MHHGHAPGESVKSGQIGQRGGWDKGAGIAEWQKIRGGESWRTPSVLPQGGFAFLRIVLIIRLFVPFILCRGFSTSPSRISPLSLSLKWEKPEQPSLTPFSLIRRVSFSFTPFSARAHSIVVRLFSSAPGSKTIKERVLRTPRLRRQRRIAARQSQFKFTCEARSPLFVLLLLHSISFSICNKPHDSCKIDCMTTSRVWCCVKWARKLRGPRHYSNQLPPLYL